MAGSRARARESSDCFVVLVTKKRIFVFVGMEYFFVSVFFGFLVVFFLCYLCFVPGFCVFYFCFFAFCLFCVCCVRFFSFLQF